MDIVLCMDILENPYLGDNLSKGFETLQASQSDEGLRVGKVSSLNSKLSVYRKSGILQENYSKKSISQPNRNLGPYPFRPFLVYATPTCGQNLSSKAFQHLERFPRQSHILLQTLQQQSLLPVEIFDYDCLFSPLDLFKYI